LYLDTILFIAGAVFVFLALLSVAYLAVSNKRSQMYRRVLREDTEFSDTFAASTWLTARAGAGASEAGNAASMPEGGKQRFVTTALTDRRPGGNGTDPAAADLAPAGDGIGAAGGGVEGRGAVADAATDLAPAGSGIGAAGGGVVGRGAIADAATDLAPAGGVADNAATDLAPADDATGLSIGASPPAAIDFGSSALEERYILRQEIHGGGMSRVFLADSAKLGNQWIVKFISNQSGELANEENILKLLNHISLPKIIDIFRDDKGVYLVESFIEGASLDKVLDSGQKLGQGIILDWAEQLAQVLNYLHKLEPNPIYHFDMKPSNVMVTHDNRLVLIDFGISKRWGEDDPRMLGVTYRYAAPEQLKGKLADRHLPLIESRFGKLPEARFDWAPDARTDIYSLGVILHELAIGQIPTTTNADALKGAVSAELYAIISKCLAIDPGARYQSAAALLADLQKAKGSKVKMARTLFMRKFAAVACACTFVFSGSSFAGGYYLYAQENAAILDVDPEMLTLSLQQSSELAVEKRMPSGNIELLDNKQIKWSYSANDVARVDGGRIAGINIGEATLYGLYRNKEISLHVRVVEPMGGMVDISQRYQPGRAARIYAGTTERDAVDGALADAEFVSPESVAVSADGTVYVVDAGTLRRIRDGAVETMRIEPNYLSISLVRCHGDDVYLLTHAWEDKDRLLYGIIRISSGGSASSSGSNGGGSASSASSASSAIEGFYLADAAYTAIEDFQFTPDGLLCFIERNAGVGGVFLKTIDPRDPEDIRALCELPEGAASLAIDQIGAMYIANPETGTIQLWRDDALSYFAGVEQEKAFIDGRAPLFYMPLRIKCADNALYVWDFNVLRMIGIEGGVATECISIVGEASPTYDLDIASGIMAAEEIVLPNSTFADFAVMGEGVLLTDPRRGVIWQVQ
jgi:serine/threonine protein kinase